MREDDVVAFKVSSNENPYPPLSAVRRVIESATEQVNRYPDPTAVELRHAIAAHHSVPVEHVAVGTGAAALCYQFAHATVGPGDDVLFAWRSFEAYPILTSVAGARSVHVPLTESGDHDLSAMAQAVTERTRLIFVCSPNNPTGTVVSQADLDAFLDSVPSDILVVLDEAYVEFSRDPEAAQGIPTYRDRPNVAVLRTFSKAYGLAGLRVGYSISAPTVIEALQKTALPFGVSSIGQAAAIASLEATSELMERVDSLIAERERMQERLTELGVAFVPSQANFIWIPAGSKTDEFAQVCERSGLTVRAFSGDGVRVTVAEPEANDRFIGLATTLV